MELEKARALWETVPEFEGPVQQRPVVFQMNLEGAGSAVCVLQNTQVLFPGSR